MCLLWWLLGHQPKAGQEASNTPFLRQQKLIVVVTYQITRAPYLPHTGHSMLRGNYYTTLDTKPKTKASREDVFDALKIGSVLNLSASKHHPSRKGCFTTALHGMKSHNLGNQSISNSLNPHGRSYNRTFLITPFLLFKILLYNHRIHIIFY